MNKHIVQENHLLDINIFNSTLYRGNNKGTVAEFYRKHERYPFLALEYVPSPEGVDAPDDDWYTDEDAPQWLRDYVGQVIPPVLSSVYK